ncbi:MAG: hypothetical protein EA342_17160 [Leptolyngbya sp. LCM1.Bin17]|nr:MAG: hypothetical protein EA342_17160 [Leptolyngbya sp. LCM1.Bin17]
MVQTPYSPSISLDAIPTAVPPSSLDSTIKAALEHARRLTDMYGTSNIEVALAWEAVDELETARTHQKTLQMSSLERYCAAYPDAPECRIYED